MSCFVTALSATLGKSLSNPVPPTSGVCLAGGAAAEKRVPGPQSHDLPACAPRNFGPQRGAGDPERRARSLLRGRERGGGAPPFSGVPGTSALSHRWPRESNSGAARVAEERAGLGVPGWRSAGDLVPRAPSSPVGRLGHVDQARGAGARPLSSPPLSLSLVGNLARRVLVAMGRGRRDPELTGSRLLGGGARGSPRSRRGRRCDCSERPADAAASQPHAAAAAVSGTPRSCRGPRGSPPRLGPPRDPLLARLLRGVAGTEVPRGEASRRSRVPARGLCGDKLLRVLRSSLHAAERARNRTLLPPPGEVAASSWRAGNLWGNPSPREGTPGPPHGRGRAFRVGMICK